MSVSLPAVLILLDFFRRDNRSGRFPFTVADKVPYLAGALAVTFAAFYGQIK